MKPNNFAFAAALALATFCVSEQADAKSRAERRQERQAKRMRHANAQGELTRGEENALRKQQEHLDRKIEKMSADGLTDKEKAKIEKMQDRASRKIHRLTNNGRKVEGAEAPSGESGGTEPAASE